MNDNGRITCDKKLYVNVNRRFLDVNHLLRALRRVIQFRFVLPCPQGLALAFEGATARLVWLLFFFLFIISKIFFSICPLFFFISRSVALDMPVRGSRILGFSKFRETKAEKNFHFTRRATEEELWVAHDAKWTRILENFIFSFEHWAFCI